MKKEINEKRKILFIIFVLILIIILIVFGSQLYLSINLLLGNDLNIRLTSEKENLFLFNNEVQQIIIKTSVLMNPFCSAKCNFSFIDISQGKILEKDSFNIKTSDSMSKNYNLTAPNRGGGQNLYKFDIECNGIETYLCHTDKIPKKRSLLITLDCSLPEDIAILKQESKTRLFSSFEEIKSLFYISNGLNVTINDIGLDFSNIKEELSKTDVFLTESLGSLLDLQSLWNNEDYQLLLENLNKNQPIISDIKTNLESINQSIYSNISVYNQLIENLTDSEQQFKSLQSNNLSYSTFTELNSLIANFNNLVMSFNKTEELSEKQLRVSDLLSKIETLSSMIQKEQHENITLNYTSNNTLIFLNIQKLSFKTSNFSFNYSLEIIEPSLNCPFSGNKEECCDDSCFDNKDKFPLIFLHGHDFSETVSSEYNLNAFDSLQRKLEEKGYINAGSIFLTESQPEKGVWGKNQHPITVKASYYFDVFKDTDKTIVFQTKQDNIDTYAIRLNDIINTVKYKTNRQKVILITHSMGGLVARRYIQIFGQDSVEKLIMVASPNKGISKNTLNYCLVFGAKKECEDMDKESLFINKLNQAQPPSISIFNIIGIGCDTDGEQGDSVVQNSSAYLSYAKNYYVKGDCNTFEVKVLHTDIIYPEKYPETYELISKNL